MSAVVFTLAALVWLVAAYAFVRLVLSWIAVARAAPTGQAWSAMFNLGLLNYPQVRQVVGQAAEPHIARYSRSIGLFAACVFGLVVLVVINIALGKAA